MVQEALLRLVARLGTQPTANDAVALGVWVVRHLRIDLLRRLGRDRRRVTLRDATGSSHVVDNDIQAVDCDAMSTIPVDDLTTMLDEKSVALVLAIVAHGGCNKRIARAMGTCPASIRRMRKYLQNRLALIAIGGEWRHHPA